MSFSLINHQFSISKEKKKIKLVLGSIILLRFKLKHEVFHGLNLKLRNYRSQRSMWMLALALMRQLQSIHYTTTNLPPISQVRLWGQWIKGKGLLSMSKKLLSKKYKIKLKAESSLRRLLHQHSLILMKTASINISMTLLQVQDLIFRSQKYPRQSQVRLLLVLEVARDFKLELRINPQKQA